MVTTAEKMRAEVTRVGEKLETVCEHEPGGLVVLAAAMFLCNAMKQAYPQATAFEDELRIIVHRAMGHPSLNN